MFRKICLAVAATAVVAGCGRQVARPDEGVGTSAAPVWVSATCPSDAAGTSLQLGHGRGGGVPAGFRTAWVLRCRTETRHLPRRGRWTVMVAERADTDAAALLAQLRRPSDTHTTGVCAAVFVAVPYFVLVDGSGRALRPSVPTDGCGQPRRAVLRALAALPFRTSSVTPLRRVTSQAALDSGCPQQWKDGFAIEARHARPAPARPLWPAATGRLRVCVYDRISGTGVPVGRFRYGDVVTGAPAHRIVAALDDAGAARPCAVRHTGIAVVTREGRAGPAVAELDGCHRLLRPDGTLGRLDPEALRLLVTAAR